MASKSNLIVETVADALGKLEWVKGVHRLFLSDSAPDFGVLGNQLPAILLDERLPLPLGMAGKPLIVKSRLPIPVWVCLPSRKEDQPTDFRSALGEVVAKLLTDPTWGGQAITTTIDPEAQAPPADSGMHVEFGILCNITYLHTPAET